MKLYRFSPIENEEQLLKAIKYTVIKTTKLSEKIVGKKYPINSLTIFSHFDDEYKKLNTMLYSFGKLFNENNGPRVKLFKPIKIENNNIEYIRIRKPDIERLQVGCTDFNIDYESFKEKYFSVNSKNLKLIKRKTYDMIELFDLNFDVLGYVVSTNH